ncbi:P-loop containing nucleoside triphosphate hydrolase protein, partial [Cladochytrium replicatum]
DSAVLVAGETGCGKTLAYLIPLFHYLKNEEDAHGGVGKRERDDEVEVGHRDAQMITTEAELRRFISEGTLPLSTSHSGDPGSNLARPRHPRAIILVPTRELVLQTTRLAKQLSHHARLRIFGTLPRYTLSTLSRHLHALPVDVLITTPGTLLRLTDSAVVNLSSAKHVVVDEADTILDPTQSDDEWTRARALLGDAPRRYTFTTATLPKAVLKGLENEFPSLVKIGTRKLHRPSGGSKHYSFLYIDRSTTKLNMLLDVLRRAVGVDSHVLVFCNTRSSARKLTSELRDLKYDVVELSSDSGGSEAIERLVGARESGSAGAKVYVATDMASRGIDTRLCTHVVMYDFPSTAVDFLHRAGRTGRGGGKGRVTCIVGRREVRVAEGIEKAVRSKGVVA